MKISSIASKSVRFLIFLLLGVGLFVFGVCGVLYAPWFQDYARVEILRALNTGDKDMRIELRSLRLRFPLQLEIGGLAVVTSQDTIVAAESASANVRLLPLLAGEVEVNPLKLSTAKFHLGAPDSAMYMRIAARSMNITPAKVRLRDMDITLAKGTLDGARVYMLINPDTTAVDTVATSEPTNMAIHIGHIDLHDFAYTMRMLPTIDLLEAAMDTASIDKGDIDLRNQHIALTTFLANKLSATYLMPDEATLAALPPIPEKPSNPQAQPWQIDIDSIGVSSGSALYTTRGYEPLAGFDPAYISVSNLQLQVNNFFNRASTLIMPLKVSGLERCGVDINATGTVAIDSVALRLDEFNVALDNSRLHLDAMMGMGNLAADPYLPLSLRANGFVGVADMRAMFPAFTPYFAALPPMSSMDVDVDAHGSMSHLDVNQIRLQLPGAVRIQAKGYVSNIMEPKNLAGNMQLDGAVSNPTVLNRLLLNNSPSLGIPALTLKGNVAINKGDAKAKLTGTTMGGTLALDGEANINSEGYEATVVANSLPLKPFLPQLPVGLFSGKLTARGHGFNPLAPTSELHANLDVSRLDYDGYAYRDINAFAYIDGGEGRLDLKSYDPALNLDLTADAVFDTSCYTAKATLNGSHIDLKALNFSATPAVVVADLTGNFKYCTEGNDISGILNVNNFDFTEDVGRFTVNDVRARLNANDSVTNFSIRNRDLYAFLSAQCGLDSLLTGFTDAADVVAQQIKARTINVDQLQRTLPRFVLDVHAGNRNMLTDVLGENHSGFKSLKMQASNDSLLMLHGNVMGFYTSTTRLDSISLNINQVAQNLDIRAHVGNRPGTFDDWARVDVTGTMGNNRLDVLLNQHNIKGEQGFRIGANVQAADSTLTLRLSPLDPVIGYKQWTVNPDNFIYLNIPAKHLDANLRMSGAGSSLALFTNHDGGDDHTGDHDHEQEDINLQLKDIHLADWININPFAPPIKGDLSADMKVNYNGSDINGNGKISLTDLVYGKETVGSFESNVNLTTNASGTLRATADLYVNGLKTMTLAGNLNDSTAMSPFNMDFSMIRFPMSVVNPFLPSGTVKLAGVLNGSMKISGDSEHPVFNGYLNFDSTTVNAAITATKYAFSSTKIPVKDNLVTFSDFAISGVNNNPLRVNGTVDISRLASPSVNLTFKASNMQLVNSSRAARGADVYGKAFVDVDAKVWGNMRLLNIDASLGVMPGTDVTYVMPDAQSVIQSKNVDDMVKFVNLADTTQVQQADSVAVEGMLMNIDALLTINPGTAINVDLSADGKNKVILRSQGTLNYTQTPLSEGRMTGRININGGQVAYSPPFMSEKLFKFNEGSYVAFTGDMLNPQLNVHATDVVKANITQEGQNSRLINFDVLLGVTGTLDRMDVAFDLATDDDVTVANELQSMSAEQRANQAMNLLLYKTYTGPGAKGDANLSGNMLYSFLTSQLNTWAANSIRGVDISFGIDQYNTTTDGVKGQAMSYSYQVSKSLFDNRFKIVVGGNYTTDADADENFSQNLISNISFEYYLNKSQTMYLKLFRHTDFESILEGEVTQTGVGFVYKRKIGSFWDIFRRRKAQPAQVLPQQAASPQP